MTQVGGHHRPVSNEEAVNYVLLSANEHDVKFIRLWFTDILGTLKGFAITVDDTEQPDFLAGLLEAAIGMLGGKSPTVALEATREDVSHFLATWR